MLVDQELFSTKCCYWKNKCNTWSSSPHGVGKEHMFFSHVFGKGWIQLVQFEDNSIFPTSQLTPNFRLCNCHKLQGARLIWVCTRLLDCSLSTEEAAWFGNVPANRRLSTVSEGPNKIQCSPSCWQKTSFQAPSARMFIDSLSLNKIPPSPKSWYFWITWPQSCKDIFSAHLSR